MQKWTQPPTCLDQGLHACAQTAIFSAKPYSNKSAPANRKTGFYENGDPNKQEVGFIFAWSGSELLSLFQYSRVKFKNQEPIAVDVLFKAYPMVPLSSSSIQSGQTVPLKVGTNENGSACGRWPSIGIYFSLWWSWLFIFLIWPPSLNNSISFSAYSSWMSWQHLTE